MALTVQNLLNEKSQDLQLEILAGHEGLNREISVSELNRPGLALGGVMAVARMAAGGHFLSDAIFAGLIAALEPA